MSKVEPISREEAERVVRDYTSAVEDALFPELARASAERLALWQRILATLDAQRETEEALRDMVNQFAYERSKDSISTGGLSALEGAFATLGLPDPCTREQLWAALTERPELTPAPVVSEEKGAVVRVAKALAEADGENPEELIGETRLWTRYLPHARAALAALGRKGR